MSYFKQLLRVRAYKNILCRRSHFTSPQTSSCSVCSSSLTSHLYLRNKKQDGSEVRCFSVHISKESAFPLRHKCWMFSFIFLSPHQEVFNTFGPSWPVCTDTVSVIICSLIPSHRSWNKKSFTNNCFLKKWKNKKNAHYNVFLL